VVRDVDMGETYVLSVMPSCVMYSTVMTDCIWNARFVITVQIFNALIGTVCVVVV